MNQPSEQLCIPCPVCYNSHVYKIVVERDVMMGWGLSSGSAEVPRRVRFERLFVCPEKNTDFQATLTLTDTSLDRIKRVEVGEAVTEKPTDAT